MAATQPDGGVVCHHFHLAHLASWLPVRLTYPSSGLLVRVDLDLVASPAMPQVLMIVPHRGPLFVVLSTPQRTCCVSLHCYCTSVTQACTGVFQ
jgi:hypothetical protein